jgi:hypothetical protein
MMMGVSNTCILNKMLALLFFVLISTKDVMSSPIPNIYFPVENVPLNDRVGEMTIFTIIAGALSALSSFAVMLTPFMFPTMWHGKICMQMIVMISLCDFFVGIVIAFGFPSGVLCSVSGNVLGLVDSEIIFEMIS